MLLVCRVSKNLQQQCNPAVELERSSFSTNHGVNQKRQTVKVCIEKIKAHCPFNLFWIF
jgi:hypothetical protein